MQVNGLLQVASPHTVDETVHRLKSVFSASVGCSVFALGRSQRRSGEGWNEDAADEVADLRQSEGRNAADGGAPSLAIDLPLKALVAEDEDGKVWVSYNSPEYLQQRHGVPEELIKNIAVLGALVAKAVE